MTRARRTALALLAAVALGACGGGDEEPPPRNEPAPAPPQADVAPELRAAVDQAPEDPAARRQLGIALHEVGRDDEAIAEFERLVALEPSTRHLLDLALAYGAAEREQDAMAVYDRILAASPEHPIALHNLGNIARGRGEDRQAIDYYSRAIATYPDYLIAHYHLAQMLQQAGRYAEAYRSYERVLQIEPRDAEDLLAADDALYRLATIDLKMGAVERAAAFLEQVLEANPGHPQAHHDYGEALMKLGRREEAAAQLDQHMRLQAERDGVRN